MGWREFWDGEHSIYVSDRHRRLHYRQVARDIAALVPSRDAHVLDVGCGEALSADIVADACGRLYLCDAAPSVRAGLIARHVSREDVQVLPPEAVESAIPEGSLDLVVANSLVQYLKRDELEALLGLWRGRLKAGGILVVADVIPPDVGPLADAGALLRFAFTGGFLIAAVAGLARTALSDYRTIRARNGIATYAARDMERLLREAGFAAVRQRDNIGHNPRRMTFVAQKRD
jgi:SAM-dependent methyltransferase